MTLEVLQPLLDWIAANQAWAGLVVFLIAMAESLAIVGLFMPGAVLMFAIGALIATGALSFYSTMLWAVAGAVAGDGISFWLGYHYQDRLRKLWPFSRYPKLMSRGERFFERHGGKSILIGRFVGPVRPIIPAVAGMMGMSPFLFSVINVASALLWAPAYLLPGMAFAASLGMAAEVGGRLVVMVLVLLVSLLVVFWSVRFLYRLSHRHATRLINYLLAWSAKHPRLGPLLASVVDPEKPELKGVLMLSGLLFLLAWVTTALFWQLFGSDPLAALDQRLIGLATGLHNPWATQWMLLLTAAGQPEVLLAVVVVVALWLSIRREWLAVTHWLGIALYGFLLPLLLSGVLHWQGVAYEGWALTLMVAVYGFLAILIAREMQPTLRWLPYTAAGCLVLLIVLAELYLLQQTLSESLIGLLLGLALVVLLGTAFWRHVRSTLPIRYTAMVAMFSLLGAMLVYLHYSADRGMMVAPEQEEISITMAEQAWWRDKWRELPIYRVDLEGRMAQPMNIQWLGELGELETLLAQQGWQRPQQLGAGNILQWLAPEPDLLQLPLLPHIHAGQHETLRMAVRIQGGAHLLVLRLWPAGVVMDEGQPLWIGSVTYQSLVQHFSLFSFLRTTSEYDEPLYDMQPYLDGLRWKWGIRNVRPAKSTIIPFSWSGNNLLLRQQ